MATLPLGTQAYERVYGQTPEVKLVNRFFEENPTNQEEHSALLTRPPTAFLTGFGEGPVRRLFTQPGAFEDNLFIVSGTAFGRYDGVSTTSISGTIADNGTPEMTVSAGPGYEHLFITDGLLLQYYDGTAHATGILTLTPNSPPDISTQVTEIGGVYYEWAASISGTPVGSIGDPFQVKVGASDAESISNLLKAINASGVAGVDYSSTITNAHTLAEATSSTTTTLEIRAILSGTGGNFITTSLTGSDLAWGDATLSGGGDEALHGVTVPDGAGVVAVATLGGHTVVVLANSQRWYYIPPGEITIDPLDFYSAEKQTDEIINVKSVGDVLMFFGESSTELWYLTGDSEDPFAPVQGQTFDQGIVQGTDVKVDDSVIFVGEDNVVYELAGRPQRISTHGIEERIRIARELERNNI